MEFCASISLASVNQAFSTVKQINKGLKTFGKHCLSWRAASTNRKRSYCFTLQPIRTALITGFPRALRPRSQTCAEEKSSGVENGSIFEVGNYIVIQIVS